MKRLVASNEQGWTFAWRGAFGLLVLCVLGTSLSGCDFQRMAVKQSAEVFAEGSIAMESESDPELARQAMPANIKTLETFLVSVPDNETLLELLAESYYSYAFGFLEFDLAKAQVEMAPEKEIDELTDRTVDYYLRARDYGFRLLDKPAFEKAAKQPNIDRVNQLLKGMTRADVPGLFWVGYGWGSAINLAQQDPNMAAQLPVVEAIMKRVGQLNDKFYYSGVYTFFGVYYASKPKIAGGNPEKAKEFFESAMKREGDTNLMVPFLYGRWYGAQTQDRVFFTKMMKKVLETDVKGHPELRLNNELARERARFWVAHSEELFIE